MGIFKKYAVTLTDSLGREFFLPDTKERDLDEMQVAMADRDSVQPIEHDDGSHTLLAWAHVVSLQYIPQP